MFKQKMLIFKVDLEEPIKVIPREKSTRLIMT